MHVYVFISHKASCEVNLCKGKNVQKGPGVWIQVLFTPASSILQLVPMM